MIYKVIKMGRTLFICAIPSIAKDKMILMTWILVAAIAYVMGIPWWIFIIAFLIGRWMDA